jgi:acyl carrier protein
MSRNTVVETAAAPFPLSGTRRASAQQGASDDSTATPGPSTPAPGPSQVEATVRDLIDRYGHPHGELIAMRRPLADMGVDLLALVEIVMSLESQFDIELDPEEILSWLTAADIAETLEATLHR